jgi:uroporphyrinogen decarboxylase
MMEPMTKKERVRAALAGDAVDRVPVSMWGHDYLREWSPDELAAATVESYRAYDWDFIKLNPRASYFSEAWGNRYDRPEEQRSPRPTEFAVQSSDDLRAIAPADPRGGVFAEHLEALRLVLEGIGGEADVIQTIFSPLAVTAMLAGPTDRFLELAQEDPVAAHHAVGTVTETLGAYAGESMAAGASGIFFAPLTWASYDTCDAEFYEEFGRPYDMQVLDGVRGAEFNVLHVCRDHNMLDQLLDYPVTAVNWAAHGEGNPSLAEVRARFAGAVMGGVDHARLGEMSPAEAARQARDAAAAGPERVLVAPGCSIPPSTPPETRSAVVNATRS